MGAVQSVLCNFGSSDGYEFPEDIPVFPSASRDENEEGYGTWKVGLGAGCYWGTEKFILHKFPKREGLPEGRIISGKVGFMGPKKCQQKDGEYKGPSYKEVCSGKTHYVEVYHCEFEGGPAYFEAMIRYFFMFHDPTTKDKQGSDVGTQYASVIYCFNKKQFDIAHKVKQEVQELLNSGKLPKKAYSSVRVQTDIRKAESPFFPAHAEHQDYLTENPHGYCNHGMKFKDWPTISD